MVLPFMRTELQRSRTDSGAPLTKRAPLPLSLTRTDIILRSRENSNVSRRGIECSKYSLTALARAEADRADSDLVSSPSRQPIFSARTLSAASVGSPTFV